MKDDRYSELMLAWLDGSLTEDQKNQLDKYLANGEIKKQELDELHQIQLKLSELPSSEPSEQMRDNFYTWLEKQKKAPKKHALFASFKFFLFNQQAKRMVIGLAILVIGFTFGMLYKTNVSQKKQLQQLSSQVNSMKEMMVLTLLDQPSSFQRLKAVDMSADISHANGRVLQALFKTLNSDPNVNVRLSALEVLARHSQNPKVREGLVQSIDQQQSPMLQVTMAELMLNLKVRKSVTRFQQLLKDKNLNQTARTQIQKTILALS